MDADAMQKMTHYINAYTGGHGAPTTSATSEHTDDRVDVLRRHQRDAYKGMPESLKMHTRFRPNLYTENVPEWCVAQLELFKVLLLLPNDHGLVTLFRAMQRNQYVERGEGKKQPSNLALLVSTGTVVQTPSYPKKKTCYERNPSMEGMATFVLKHLEAKITEIRDELTWMRCVDYTCTGCNTSWTGGDMFTTGSCPSCQNTDVVKTDRTDTQRSLVERLIKERDCLFKAFTKSTEEHAKCLHHALWVQSQPLYKRDDHQVPLLDIKLREEFKNAPRPYQLECIKKTEGKNGHALMPCGAGKSLTMILKIIQCGRSTLLLVPNAEAAEQMRTEIMRWTSIHPNHIVLLTSNRSPPKWFLNCVQRAQFYPMIFVTTYGMTSVDDVNDDTVMERATKRARTAIGSVATSTGDNKLFRSILSTAMFGLVIIDEAHMAATKRRDRGITRFVRGYDLPLDSPERPNFFGFTGTRERLDFGMQELVQNLLGGPMLYDVSIKNLQQQGHIATVYIKAMTFSGTGAGVYSGSVEESKFAKDYQTAWLRNERRLNIMHNIIQTHYARNKDSRIIIVVERRAMIDAIKLHPLYKNAMVVNGDVHSNRRNRIYRHFRKTPGSLLLVSKVGEVAVDLPDANVLILPACLDRASKVQYIGRVQRKKRVNVAFAHMLCDTDNTQERTFMHEQLKAVKTEGYNISVEPIMNKDWMTGPF